MKLNTFTQLHTKDTIFWGHPIAKLDKRIIFKCSNGQQLNVKNEDIEKFIQNR